MFARRTGAPPGEIERRRHECSCWLILIGGVGALVLAFLAMRGPSASKTVKRRIELIQERHGDVIAGNAQAQIRKLFAERASSSRAMPRR